MSRRKIIEQRARHREPLCTTEWGDGLFIRRLGARKKLELEEWTAKVDGLKENEKALDALTKFVVLCVIEESGDPAFAAEDLDWLKDQDEVVLMAAFNQAMALNRNRPEDLEAAKKNSGDSPSAAGASSSAAPSTTSP